jgi:hypothetical protein
MPVRLDCSLRILRGVTLVVMVSVTLTTAWSQQSDKPDGRAQLAGLPLNFEPNVGQAGQPAQFIARAANLNATFSASGVDVLFDGAKRVASDLALEFVGADRHTRISGIDPKTSYSNYVLGADPSRWLSHVPNFGRVTYSSLYPGIDLVFYGYGGRLEHDFVIQPGADYGLIRIRVEGPRRLQLRRNRNLTLLFPGGEVTFEKPQVYQLDAGVRTIRRGRFVLLGKEEIGFAIGNYDKSEPLIIDPVLSYSTYLANVPVTMAGVATDVAGDTFVTGLTFASNFPVTPDAFQPACKSCGTASQTPDVFISKFNASGTALVYSTFLGGSDYDEPFALAVDALGNAVVAGRTMSTDFPVKNAIPVGFSGTGTFYGFISSLTADGSALNYSSILGGGAEAGQSSTTIVGGVAVDANGNAYISGTTDSPVFPVTPGALNLVTPAYPKTVALVSKFIPAGSLGYSALLGDTAPQNGGGGLIGVFGVAVDSSGSAYITGAGGTLWPTTTGAFQTSIPGTMPYAAPFVTKLSPTGSSLAYSTFLGDGGWGTAIAVNPSTGHAFVTGIYSAEIISPQHLALMNRHLWGAALPSSPNSTPTGLDSCTLAISRVTYPPRNRAHSLRASPSTALAASGSLAPPVLILLL